MAHEEVVQQFKALSGLVVQTQDKFEGGKIQAPHGEIVSEIKTRRLRLMEALDDAVPEWEQAKCKVRIAQKMRKLNTCVAELLLKLFDSDEKARRQRTPERKSRKEAVVRKVRPLHVFKTAYAAVSARDFAAHTVVNLMDGRHSHALIIEKLKDFLEIVLSVDNDQLKQLAHDGSTGDPEAFKVRWHEIREAARHVAESTSQEIWLNYARGMLASAYDPSQLPDAKRKKR